MPRPKKNVFDPSRYTALPPEQLVDLLVGMSNAREAVERFSQPTVTYADNPMDFARQTLGLDLWAKQYQVIESVFKNKLTVVSSGHGTGKSVAAAIITAWFLSYYGEDTKVITIAPTHAQLEGVLWRYIRTYARKNGLPGHVFETPRWEVGPDQFAIGLSPKKASVEDVATIQGYHAQRLLVILDEAAGLPRVLWEAVQGLVVGEQNKILAIGNPIEQSGPFWEACTSKAWNYIQISCLDHPNVVEGREVIPGAVSRQWVDEHVGSWCTTCDPYSANAFEWEGAWYLPMPIFQARVLGIAPEMGEDQLIKLSWITAAEEREFDPDDLNRAERVIGFDPAPRGGDDNALCPRIGPKTLPIERRKSHDNMELAGWLAAKREELSADVIYVDDTGGGGVTDKARELGLPVVAVVFGARAYQAKRFANQRTEMYWRLREALREGKISLPHDSLLSGDLTAPKFTYDPIGRIVLESKDEIKKRIGRSPDSGDALAVTFSSPLTDQVPDLQAMQKELSGKGAAGYASRWIVTGKKRVGSRWRK